MVRPGVRLGLPHFRFTLIVTAGARVRLRVRWGLKLRTVSKLVQKPGLTSWGTIKMRTVMRSTRPQPDPVGRGRSRGWSAT